MSSDELQPSHPNNYNRSTRVASTAVTHRYVLMDRLRLGLSPPVDCIISHACNHTGTTPTTAQPFYGPISGTIRVSWCQKITSGLRGAGDD